ncbi:MAG: hypothetical protein WBZ45_11860 [Acidimicrobiia bacterium]
MGDETGRSLDPEQVSRILVALQHDFGWEGNDSHFELIDSWGRPRSGSDFYRVAGNHSANEMVVKVVPDWTVGTAKKLYGNMVDLDDMISAADLSTIHGVRPLAWSDEPPALVMPYLPGDDVVSILRRPTDPAWTSGAMLDWMEWAGTMLAAYHLQTEAPTQDERASARREAQNLAGKLRIKREAVDRLLAGIDDVGLTRRRFGDFGPGNLQGTPDGSLYLLDPPDTREVSLIHRDIANFIFELRRQLAGHGFTRYPPVKGRFEDFRRRFVSGYLKNWPGLDMGADDEALIALFEANRAAGMAMKRFPGRLSDALWFGRLALRRRRDVTRTG